MLGFTQAALTRASTNPSAKLVASLEVDWERVGLMELMVSWKVEGENGEKMERRWRLEGGTPQFPSPKPRLWTSRHEPVSTFVVYPF